MGVFLNAVTWFVAVALLYNNGLVFGATAQNVRLVGSPDPHEGRLEVYMNGQWGTVCDDGVGYTLALVVCRILGFPTSVVKVFPEAYFGLGTGEIHLDDVVCIGNETELDHCQFNSTAHNCAHSEDIGIRCGPAQVRLVNGANSHEGRLEVYRNGQWGSVCDDRFDYKPARVVCRMLGFPTAVVTAFHGAKFGQGSGPIHLTDVVCTENEVHLYDCSYSTRTFTCDHSEDVGVRCEKGCLADYNHTACLNAVVVDTSYTHCRAFKAVTHCIGVQLNMCPELSQKTDMEKVRVMEEKLCTELNLESTECEQYANAHDWQTSCTVDTTEYCTSSFSYGQCALNDTRMGEVCRAETITALSQYYIGPRGWACFPTTTPATTTTATPPEQTGRGKASARNLCHITMFCYFVFVLISLFV